jgi:hypothetical protein
MEFIAMLGMAIVVVIIMVFLLSNQIDENWSEKNRIVLSDYGFYIQNEFLLAQESTQGYQRTVTVPDKIEGIPFTIYNTNRYLIVNYSKGSLPPWIIPNTRGNITKGVNVFRNIDGSVCINC